MRGMRGGRPRVYSHMRAESRGIGERTAERARLHVCKDAWKWRGASDDAQLRAWLVAWEWGIAKGEQVRACHSNGNERNGRGCAYTC
jgi:hypothetical protein